MTIAWRFPSSFLSSAARLNTLTPPSQASLINSIIWPRRNLAELSHPLGKYHTMQCDSVKGACATTSNLAPPLSEESPRPQTFQMESLLEAPSRLHILIHRRLELCSGDLMDEVGAMDRGACEGLLSFPVHLPHLDGFAKSFMAVLQLLEYPVQSMISAPSNVKR